MVGRYQFIYLCVSWVEMVPFPPEPLSFKYLWDITNKVNVMQVEDKQKLRKRIWGVLEDNDHLRTSKSCFGRIPNFKGAYQAAERLRKTKEWQDALTVFSSPDSALVDVRRNALVDGKVLVMAAPQLKEGYLLLDPGKIRGQEEIASTIDGAFQLGERIKSFPQVDLVVEGSLGVDLQGNRLGKGKGFADQELAFLKQEGVIGAKTPICTPVHPRQIVSLVPVEAHDEGINMITTPEMVIRMDIISLVDFHV